MTDQSLQILETDRLILRIFEPSDLEAFAAIEADPEVMRYYNSGPRSRDRAERAIAWFIELQEKFGHSLWAIEKKGRHECIGYCGLVPQSVAGRQEIEIGYKLAHEFWNQGYATEAAAAVREWGFSRLPVNRLISLIDPLNVASIRVAEKIGMRYVQNCEYDGKDCRVYAISRALS
ncbi:MAG TPA: GNAT family N-acetyltransferase [Fimbriimonadaceae bacterium]|nr:GNAT family N-acetyltransferase [Fimbriimonadaceae bacterium]